MVKLERFIDKTLGAFLSGFLGLISKPFNLAKPKSFDKILIIKLWAIGDSVVTLPMISSIKKTHPNSKITVLARKRNYLAYKGNKDVDKVILFEKGFNIFKLIKRFDIALDLEPYLNLSAILSFLFSSYRIGFSHGIRSLLYNKKIKFNKKQHMVQNYLDFAKAIGAKNEYKSLIKLPYSQKEEKKISHLFKTNKIQKKDYLIGISPTVAESVKVREWPKERFAELILRILQKKKNSKIIIVGITKDKPEINKLLQIIKEYDVKNISKKRVLNLAGCTDNLFEFFCLADKFNLFIGNDTGSMHIAAAQGVKTIGLFGPNTPVLWAPYGLNNVSIYSPPSTGPIIDNTTGYMPSENQLTKEQKNCMKQIKVEEVLKYV